VAKRWLERLHQKYIEQLALMEYVCNPSTLEADVEGAGISGQPELHNELLSQKHYIEHMNKHSFTKGKVVFIQWTISIIHTWGIWPHPSWRRRPCPRFCKQ
jgi:hypothetical protein